MISRARQGRLRSARKKCQRNQGISWHEVRGAAVGSAGLTGLHLALKRTVLSYESLNGL